MRDAAHWAGLAAIASAVVLALTAFVIAMTSQCLGEGSPCNPQADGTPWLIAGVGLGILGAGLAGWGASE